MHEERKRNRKGEAGVRAAGVRGATGGWGGAEGRAAAAQGRGSYSLLGRQCRADLVVRASTSPLLRLPGPPLSFLLPRPSHPRRPELTVPRARPPGQGQGHHDPRGPQVPAAAHHRAGATSLAVAADGTPRPGYVTLPPC